MIQQYLAKLSEKEKKIFYIAAGVVVLALFDLLFLGPVTSKLQHINEEIVDKENSLKRDLRLLSYKDRIWAERDALGPYYNAEVLTPDQVKASFLQKIEMLATDAKVNLTKVAPAGEEKQKGFVKYLADLECIGELADIVKFMHLVDSTEELLKIVKVNIVSKQSAKDVSATMTIVKIIFDPRAVWTEKEMQQKEGKKTEGKTESKEGGSAGAGKNGAKSQGAAAAGGTGESGGGAKGAGPDGGRDGDGGSSKSQEGDSGSGASGSGGGGKGVGSGKSGGGAGGEGGGGSGEGSSPQAVNGGNVGEDFSVGANVENTRSRSSKRSSDKKDENPKEEAEAVSSRVPTGGPRASTTGIVDLWNQFWGIKPKEPDQVEENAYDNNGGTNEKQDDPNLWERLGR